MTAWWVYMIPVACIFLLSIMGFVFRMIILRRQRNNASYYASLNPPSAINDYSRYEPYTHNHYNKTRDLENNDADSEDTKMMPQRETA